jgi:hypothetical protein
MTSGNSRRTPWATSIAQYHMHCCVESCIRSANAHTYVPRGPLLPVSARLSEIVGKFLYFTLNICFACIRLVSGHFSGIPLSQRGPGMPCSKLGIMAAYYLALVLTEVGHAAIASTPATQNRLAFEN